jgi:hypothetical protein
MTVRNSILLKLAVSAAQSQDAYLASFNPLHE